MRMRLLATIFIALAIPACTPNANISPQSSPTKPTASQFAENNGNLANMELMIVPGCHQDIGFIADYQPCMDEYHEQIVQYLDLFGKKPTMRYTLGNAMHLMEAVRRDPSLRQPIAKALAQGRLSSPAEWVDLDPNPCSGELLIRNITLPKFLLKETFDYDPKWYHVMDIAHITPQLAQIAARSGLKMMIMDENRFCIPQTIRSRFGYFTGLDGSKILSYYPDDRYAALTSVINLKDDTIRPEITDYLRRFAPEEKAIGTKMGICSFDNGLNAKRGAMLYDFAEKWNVTEPAGPKIRMSSMDEFVERIDQRLDKAGVKIPDYTGLAEGWEWAGAAYGWGRIYHARAEDLLPTVETLASIMELSGAAEYPTREIRDAWMDIVWTQDHNWIAGGADDDRLVSDKRAYENVSRLAARYMKKLSSQIAKPNKDQAVVVFNQLNWKRSQPVEADFKFDSGQRVEVYDSSGEVASSQLVPAGEKKFKVHFIARDIPAIGYKIYYIRKSDAGKNASPKSATTAQPADSSATTAQIENEFFSIKASVDKGFESIFDKKNAREIVDTNSNFAFGQIYCWQRQKEPVKTAPSPRPREMLAKEKMTIDSVSAVNGELFDDLFLRGTFNLSTIEVRVRLYKDQPQVNITVSLDWAREYWSNIYFALPVRLENSQVIQGVPFGSVPVKCGKFEDLRDEENYLPPTHQKNDLKFSARSPGAGIVSAFTLSEESLNPRIVREWFGFQSPGYSIAVAYANSLTETFFESSSQALVRLLINRPQVPGSWFGSDAKYQYDFAIRTFAAGLIESHSPAFGAAFSKPMLVARHDGGGDWPGEKSFINMGDDQSAIVSTFMKSNDADGYILRWYEAKDGRSAVKFRFDPALGIKRATLADLAENNLQDLKFDGGFDFATEHCEIQNVRLKK